MDKIIVIDFGSQYNQVIVKTLRKLKVYSELIEYKKISAEMIKEDKSIKGIILSGGPTSVYREDAFKIDEKIFGLNIPILGVCYGMQYINDFFGGVVVQTPVKEYGKTEIIIEKENLLTSGTPNRQDVWMSHNDSVTIVAETLEVLSSSKDHPAIIKHQSKPIYGVQFHIEVEHTEYGQKMVENFCFNICQVSADFAMEVYVQELQDKIKTDLGDQKVICALSGGVDSSVVAALLQKTIPNQVHFFFVDTGLLRLEEGEQVLELFRTKFNIDVLKIDGKKEMMDSLKGLEDPEEKRKAIGKTFITIFQKTIKEISTTEKVNFLAQGTLYSDIIESGTSTSQTIKSHHNVGGLPDDMEFQLIEPINRLFKDEVRELGKTLGLDDAFVYRQPFPGPGLGIRIIGEITAKKVEILQAADQIVRKVIDNSEYQKQIWQYFCVLTNTKSVGVKGDVRVYDYVLALRFVTAVDGMTADFARIDFETLNTISQEITNNVEGISRVVYDITGKPPGTIEWE